MTAQMEGWKAKALSRQSLISICLLLGAFSGFVIGLLGPLGGAGMLAISLLLIGIVLAASSEGRYQEWWLYIGIVGLFIAPTIQKLFGIYLWGVWQIAIFTLALLGVRRFFKYAMEERWFRAGIALTAIFFALALVSSLLGRSRLEGFLYQLMSDLKPIMVIVLGFAVVLSRKSEAGIWGLIRWLWLPSMILVAFEWGWPSGYFSLFGFHEGINIDRTGLFPSRALGVFQHPSFLGSTSALLAMACFARSMHDEVNKLPYRISAIFYFLLVVFSVQRQEFMACVVAAMLIFVLMRPDRLARVIVVSVVTLTMFGTVFLALYWEDLVQEAALWGLGAGGQVAHPRAQLIISAVSISMENFPLGTGLGTFGGAGAEKFDQSLYLDLGFGRYWWFGEKNYLMDMYWPNPIGESGLVGALALFISYVAFMFGGVREAFNSKGMERVYWSMFAGGMLYMLMLSMTSPAYQDPRLSLLASLWAGFAVISRTRVNCEIMSDEGGYRRFHLSDASIAFVK